MLCAEPWYPDPLAPHSPIPFSAKTVSKYFPLQQQYFPSLPSLPSVPPSLYYSLLLVSQENPQQSYPFCLCQQHPLPHPPPRLPPLPPPYSTYSSPESYSRNQLYSPHSVNTQSTQSEYQATVPSPPDHKNRK